MLGRVDPQGSLLETRHMRRHLVTKGSFYERLADHGHELVSDEDFAHLYAEGKGRPSVPPSVMVRAMLCATHDRTSDAETPGAPGWTRTGRRPWGWTTGSRASGRRRSA